MSYAVALATGVREMLRELAPGPRGTVVESLRKELTGAVGATTSRVEAWQLDGAPAYWMTALSCGYWVVYRELNDSELDDYAANFGARRTLGYLAVDMEIINPTAQ